MKNIYATLLIICAIAGNAQNINIPDPVFKTRLLGNNSTAFNAQGNSFSNTADTNNDGEISMAEAAAVTGLRIHSITSSSNISSLDGLQYFTNLKSLWCESNPVGGQLDLSMLTQLKYLNCRSMLLTSILLPTSGILSEIAISNNSLASLDTSILPNLQYLEIAGNDITSINLSSLNMLSYLNLSYNPLTTLNVSGKVNLKYLYLNNTLLTTIDCSSSGIELLHCTNNPNLTSINVKNNFASGSDPDMLYYAFRFENLPLLQSICIDNFEQSSINLSNYNSNGNVTVYTGANCDQVVNMDTNGLAELNKTILKLYPNPASTILTIDASAELSIENAEVYNMLGQTVMAVSLNGKSSVDVSGIPSGNYIVKATDSGGRQLVQKFIKI